VLSENRIWPRDECEDIGPEDWFPIPDVAGWVADGQVAGLRLAGPRGNGSDQAGGQGKPAGQVTQSLRGQERVIKGHPIEHLVEQSRIAAGDPDGEEDEGLGVDRPSVGPLDGR
jgi:hypothetical protein